MGNEDSATSPVQEEQEAPVRFASYAVLDLETTNLPSLNFNKVSITELSLYGFAASELEREEVSPNGAPALPRTPRVLHKLTLLFNPRMMVHPTAEEITGLNNYILEEESAFGENAAKTVLGFLQHLQQPVCLVAHNGSFDFPIFKQRFDKLKMFLPPETLCVDSLRAFFEIDEQRPVVPIIEPELPLLVLEDTMHAEASTKTDKDALSEDSEIDWRVLNETTPKRPPVSGAAASTKRKRLADIVAEESGYKRPDSTTSSTSAIRTYHSRRSLFPAQSGCRAFRKFPPKGVYKLGVMYERIFAVPPTSAHHAEGDVEMLMRLMLHYGPDFNAYAEEWAVPFAEVRKVGANN